MLDGAKQIEIRKAEEARIAEEKRQEEIRKSQIIAPVVASIIPREDVANELRSHGLPEDIVQSFLVIVQRESNFNTNAKNPYSTASGLYQFLTGTFAGYGCSGSPFNWKDATACAAKAYRMSGLQPWSLTAY